MPELLARDRLDTSASLRTTGIWANTIGCVLASSSAFRFCLWAEPWALGFQPCVALRRSALTALPARLQV